MSRSRRKPLALLAGVMVAGTCMTPATTCAQSPKRTPIIGVLGTTQSTPASVRIFEAFKQSLREGGWVDGETARFELRWSEGRLERFPALAAELVRLKVDVIVT